MVNYTNISADNWRHERQSGIAIFFATYPLQISLFDISTFLQANVYRNLILLELIFIKTGADNISSSNDLSWEDF